MNHYERRKKARRTCWEIVDVELGTVFHAETKEAAEDYRKVTELIGHRCIVKEIKP